MSGLGSRRGSAVAALLSLLAVATVPLHGQPGGMGPAAGHGDRSTGSVEHFLAQAPKGTLRVQAVQGTAGGQSPAGSPVVVDLFHDGRVLKQITAMLDERGEAVLAEIPIIMGVVPVVQVQHAGVTYQEPGELMNPEKRDLKVQVTVYDTTDETPEWRIAMRHILVKPSEAGGRYKVSEMVVVESLGDRTWLGGVPDEKDKRSTVRFDLPQGSQRVHLESGFHGWCCTKFVEPALSVQMPLMPGRSSFQFSYELNAAGASKLGFSAPAPVDHLMIFVPDAGIEAAPGAELVEVPGAAKTGRLLQGQDFAPGAVPALVLTGQATTAPTASERQQFPRWIVWAGLLALGGIAALWLARRSGSAAAARRTT